jgi:hypothetical protein
MAFTTFDYSIWAILIACNFILATLIWRERRRLHLSFFVIYAIFQLAQSITLLVVTRLVLIHLLSETWYTGLFFFQLSADYVLQLGILYQLFYALLSPYKALPDRAFQVFLAGCGTLVMAIALLVLLKPAHFENHRGASIIVDIMLSFNLLQCTGCFFVVAFASSLGLPLRHYIVGIALGLGVSNLGILALTAIANKLGLNSSKLVHNLPDLLYICSVLIWIEYFRHTESVRTALHPKMLEVLQRLKRALDRISFKKVTDLHS